MSRQLNKVKPCSAGLVLGWMTKYEHPLVLGWMTKYEHRCCNNFLFSFSPSLFNVILKLAELPALCKVISSTCI